MNFLDKFRENRKEAEKRVSDLEKMENLDLPDIDSIVFEDDIKEPPQQIEESKKEGSIDIIHVEEEAEKAKKISFDISETSQEKVEPYTFKEDEILQKPNFEDIEIESLDIDISKELEKFNEDIIESSIAQESENVLDSQKIEEQMAEEQKLEEKEPEEQVVEAQKLEVQKPEEQKPEDTLENTIKNSLIKEKKEVIIDRVQESLAEQLRNMNIDDIEGEITQSLKNLDIEKIKKELELIDTSAYKKLEPEEDVKYEFIKEQTITYETENDRYMKDTEEMCKYMCGNDSGEPLKRDLLDGFETIKPPKEEKNEPEIVEPEPIDEPINPVPPETSITLDGGKDEDIQKTISIEKLFASNGKALHDYIYGDSKFSSISENLDVCINLAELFDKLHSLGFCFNAVSSKDIVLTQKNECKILNKDVVVAVGDEEYNPIINKSCAPEIIRGEARSSKKTDLHTLTVLIFGLLFKSNPFEGKAFLNSVYYTRSDELKYYENPIFVFSHEDNSNEPVYGINSILIKYWDRYYSERLKMLFKQMFVEGVKDPESRASISDIISVLLSEKNMRDGLNNPKIDMTKIKEVPNKLKLELNKKKEGANNTKIELDFTVNLEDYKKEDFVKEPTYKSEEVEAKDVSIEANMIEEVYKIRISIYEYNKDGKHRLAVIKDLNPGDEIKNSMVGYMGIHNNEVIGKVIQNAKKKTVLGIKNISNHTWNVKKGEIKKEFMPGKVVPFTDDVEIEIDFEPENTSVSKNRYIVAKIK